MRRVLLSAALLAALALAGSPAGAGAAAATEGTARGTAAASAGAAAASGGAGAGGKAAAGAMAGGAARLAGNRPLHRVRDVVLPRPLPRARTAGARGQTFLDPEGRAFRVTTAVPGADLAGVAAVLAATKHGDEIVHLRSHGVRLADVGEICGSPLAVACYAPDAPGRRASGQMVFAVDDPDLTHTLIHEYGHHLDFQHPNLDHLGLCPAGADGTRGWFFAREAEQRISRRLTCDPFAAWDQLIGEAYAEDYVAANGIENWTLRTLPAPSPAQRAALLADLDRPFRPARRAWSAADGARVLEVEHWTFAFVQARARRTRGVALALTPAGERTRRARARRGRTARVTALLPPGRHRLAVRGARTGGVAVRLR